MRSAHGARSGKVLSAARPARRARSTENAAPDGASMMKNAVPLSNASPELKTNGLRRSNDTRATNTTTDATREWNPTASAIAATTSATRSPATATSTGQSASRPHSPAARCGCSGSTPSSAKNGPSSGTSDAAQASTTSANAIRVSASVEVAVGANQKPFQAPAARAMARGVARCACDITRDGPGRGRTPARAGARPAGA